MGKMMHDPPTNIRSLRDRGGLGVAREVAQILSLICFSDHMQSCPHRSRRAGCGWVRWRRL